MSSTTAWRRPMMRLTRVDLPTLGRPTTATTGTGPGRRRRRLDESCGFVKAETSEEKSLTNSPCCSSSSGAARRPRRCPCRWCRARWRRRPGAAGRRAARVELVAAGQVGLGGGDVGGVLGAAALGAGGGRGGQVDLEVGVGGDDRGDVPALDDDAGGAGDDLPLQARPAAGVRPGTAATAETAPVTSGPRMAASTSVPFAAEVRRQRVGADRQLGLRRRSWRPRRRRAGRRRPAAPPR